MTRKKLFMLLKTNGSENNGIRNKIYGNFKRAYDDRRDRKERWLWLSTSGLKLNVNPLICAA